MLLLPPLPFQRNVGSLFSLDGGSGEVGRRGESKQGRDGGGVRQQGGGGERRAEGGQATQRGQDDKEEGQDDKEGRDDKEEGRDEQEEEEGVKRAGGVQARTQRRRIGHNGDDSNTRAAIQTRRG
jgi:hypothetical protein